MKRAVAAVTLAVALSTAPALAQSSKMDEAKALFNAGAQAYALGEFVAAAEAFQAAYKIDPRPGLMFSLAQAERRQYAIDHDSKRLERSIAGFRKYIEQVPQGGKRADAVAALGELQPLLDTAKVKGTTTTAPDPPRVTTSRLMVTSPTEGAKVAVDGAEATNAPFIGEVKPGTHTVVVTAAGHEPEKRAVPVVEGGIAAIDLPLREKPALLAIDAPSGAEITVDGRLAGVAPLSAPVSLNHGRHYVVVVKTGAVGWSRDVDVKRGETTKLSAELSGSGQRTVAWVVIGTSVVALAAGGVLTGLALNRESRAQSILDDRDKGNITTDRLDQYESLRDERDRFRTWSIAALGAGAALGITGVLLYVVDRPAGPTRDGASPDKGPAPTKAAPIELAAAPLITPTLMGASVAFAF